MTKKIKVVSRPTLGTYCHTYCNQLLSKQHLKDFCQRYFGLHLSLCKRVYHFHSILLNSYTTKQQPTILFPLPMGVAGGWGPTPQGANHRRGTPSESASTC